jgi:hypothetical protein
MVVGTSSACFTGTRVRPTELFDLEHCLGLVDETNKVIIPRAVFQQHFSSNRCFFTAFDTICCVVHGLEVMASCPLMGMDCYALYRPSSLIVSQSAIGPLCERIKYKKSNDFIGANNVH